MGLNILWEGNWRTIIVSNMLAFKFQFIVRIKKRVCGRYDVPGICSFKVIACVRGVDLSLRCNIDLGVTGCNLVEGL